MFRKLTLAAVAVVVGMVAAAKLTSGKHFTLSDLFEPNKGRPSAVVPTDHHQAQTARKEPSGND